MKITRFQLKQIIKEELTKALNEVDAEAHARLLQQALELLALSKKEGNVDRQAELMRQARQLLTQAAGIEQSASKAIGASESTLREDAGDTPEDVAQRLNDPKQLLPDKEAPKK